MVWGENNDNQTWDGQRYMRHFRKIDVELKRGFHKARKRRQIWSVTKKREAMILEFGRIGNAR